VCACVCACVCVCVCACVRACVCVSLTLTLHIVTSLHFTPALGRAMDTHPFGIMTPRHQRSLAEIVAAERAHMSADDVRAVALDVCACLARLHGAGTLFGGVAPCDVVRTVRRGRTCYRLFGLTKSADVTIAEPKLVVGDDALVDPAYTAPEVLRVATTVAASSE
jgi:hypothetical protein